MNENYSHNDDTFTTADQTHMPSAREEEALRQVLRRQHTPAPDIDAAWAAFAKKNRIITPTTGRATTATPSATPARSGRKHWWKAAAAIILVATIGLFANLWHKPEAPASKPKQIFAHLDEPREVSLTDKRTGRVVALEELQMNFDAEKVNNAQQSEAERGRLRLRVPRGATYQLTLADGTEVWLNSDSELIFPDRFDGGERHVKLVGEGYFKVTKDAQHPFRIIAPGFTATVLGTELNIRAYDGDAPIVSLVSGAVMLQSLQADHNNVVMKPGQTANIGANGSISVEEEDAYPYVQWKDNLFYFDNSPLQDVIREMGRWYNVDIYVENPEESRDLNVHFAADRSESLQTALDNLNELGLIQATLQDSGRVSVRLLGAKPSEQSINLHD